MGIRSLVEWVAAGAVAGQVGATTMGATAAMRLVPLAGAVAVAMLAAACRWRRVLPLACALVAAAAGAAVVVCATGVPSDPRHVAHVALPLRGRLVGRVAAPPERRRERTIVLLEADRVERDGRRTPLVGLIRLGVRGRLDGLRRGDLVAVDTTLRRPRNFGNPGAFDLEGLLARRGIHVVASAWDPARVARLAPGRVPRWRTAIDRWRDAVGASVGAAVGGDAAGVLRALVVGDDEGLAPPLREAFTRTGVVHVLSVSGLHVSIVAGLVAYALRLLLRRSARLLAVVDVDKLAVAGGVLAALGYGTLAGAAVATVRAVAMAGAAALAVVLERRADPVRCIALAALVLAVMQPGAPAEISYQLSFASVGALVIGGHRRGDGEPGGAHAWLARAGRASGAAWLGTAPLTAFHFHQVSLVSVPANLLLVPLFGAVALAPALAGAVLVPLAPAWAAACFVAAAVPVQVGIDLVKPLGGVAWSAAAVPTPSLWELALCYVVLGALLGGRRPVARLALAGALVLLAADTIAWAAVRLRPTGFRATFLDVGQGDASVVELPGGRVLVIDAGGFPASDFDTGAALVEPYLRARKIQSIDALVMSHAHPDHAGGLAHLVRAFVPVEVWWSGSGGEGRAWEALATALRETGVPLRALEAGRAIPGFPDVEVLHPERAWLAPSLNDGSVVLRIGVGTTTLAFAGDAEAAAEAAMLSRGVDPTTILKVPHHGSRTSSTWPFVAATAPRLAVLSLGAENRYGHPAAEVTERYRRVGARLFRIDRCGAVIVEGDGAGLWVRTGRDTCAPDPAIRTPPLP